MKKRALTAYILTTSAVSIIQTDPITENLALFSKSFDDLTWKISPDIVLKRLTIADIDRSTIDLLDKLTPKPTSKNELFLQNRIDIASNLFQARILRQQGVECGSRTAYNTIHLYNALKEISVSHAISSLGQLWDSSLFDSTICATDRDTLAGDVTLEEFLTNKNVPFFRFSGKTEPLDDFLKLFPTEFHDCINKIMSLYHSKNLADIKSTEFPTFLNMVIEAHNSVQKEQITPFIIQSTQAEFSKARAHWISLIAINTAGKRIFIAADSLTNLTSYGIQNLLKNLIDFLDSPPSDHYKKCINALFEHHKKLDPASEVTLELFTSG